MIEVLLGVVMFTGVVLALVGIILAAKWQLVPSGNVEIVVNDQKHLSVSVGGKLLGALAGDSIFVSSACGGGGTCGQCKVDVLAGGGDILPTERMALVDRRRYVFQQNSVGEPLRRRLRIGPSPGDLEGRCEGRGGRGVPLCRAERR